LGRLVDTLLWISRRLRLAVLALLAVLAAKTAAAALDVGPDEAPATEAPITRPASVT